jgi:LuxR family maltose regulon positive regulatory protein
LPFKLFRPRATGSLVPRPQLIEALSRRPEGGFTLVSAPAGYGKTTLLSTWLEAWDGPSAWLTLDEGDQDPATFLRGLLAALHTMFPDAGGATLPRHNAGTLPRHNAGTLPPMPDLARGLADELERIAEPFILVLDDYHTVRGLAVHELLIELLRQPPRSLHLALATRYDSPLPLSHFRARGQISEIRLEDLRFTEAETAALLRQVLGAPVDAATLSLLREKTAGQVFGLRLAALSLRQREDGDRVLAAVKASRGYVDLLLVELLARQPAAMRDWLLKTSILDRFCAPLCEAVCTPGAGPVEAAPGGKEFLKWLADAGLFVFSLDDQGEWYRYQHLFQLLLRHQLKRQHPPAEIAALHARASTWLTGNGLVKESARHAQAAGNA